MRWPGALKPGMRFHKACPLLLGILLAGGAGCSNATADSGTPRDGGATRDAARAARASDPKRGADLGKSPRPELITDEECERRGGRVHVYHPSSRRRPRRDEESAGAEVRVCTYSHQKNGQRCQNTADCLGGHCLCTGELSGPNPTRLPEVQKLDGKPGWGICSDRQLSPGSWWCLVNGGRIHLYGIIID